jgi:hypothetical protein
LASSGDFNVTRATTATRFNSAGFIESVASGVPRLDYYTSGGTAGCPALLVEASGSNGILNSQDTTTSWVLGANLSSGYTDVIGVSGNNLTVAVSGSGLGSDAGVLRRTPNNVALASGSTYTLSFFLKKTGAHTIGGYYAVITGAASGNLGGGFDVSGSFSSGSIFNTAGTTSRIRRVERFGTDVFRCSETFTMTASGTLTQLGLGPTTAVNNATHPAVGLGIAFAAPQIELGAIPTSFIPTTAAAVTRNADVINLTGSVSGCIGQTEGTIYAEVNLMANAAERRIISVTSGSEAQRIIIWTLGTTLFVSFNAATSINLGAFPIGALKIAVGYTISGGSTTYSISTNGAAVTTGTAAAGPTGLNQINLGTSATGTLGLNDRIRSAAIYTSRLSNAELIALSTL